MSVAILPFDSAVLVLKATQRPFLATGTEARVIWPIAASPLRAQNCSAPPSENAARTAFTEQEVSVLCPVLTDEHSEIFFKKTVKKQRWALGLFFLVAMLFSWQLLFAWLSGAVAEKLARRKLNPSIGGSQLSFEWRS